jgi:CheY-like chemotaxis protein
MKKILIIEDNHEIRENTAELLELNNYEVITAVNGTEGFTLAEKAMPDLILCDLLMPKSGGLTFLKLSRNHFDIRAIPTILFSAGSIGQRSQNQIMIEETNFLHKPFTEGQLLKAIETGLNRRKKHTHYNINR